MSTKQPAFWFLMVAGSCAEVAVYVLTWSVLAAWLTLVAVCAFGWCVALIVEEKK